MMLIYEPINYLDNIVVGNKITLKNGETVEVILVESEGRYKAVATGQLIRNHWATFRHQTRQVPNWKSLIVDYSPNSKLPYIDWRRTPHKKVTL